MTKTSYLIVNFSDLYNDYVSDPNLVVTEVLPIIGGIAVVGAGLVLVGFGIFVIVSEIQSFRMRQANKPAIPGGQ